LGWLEIYFRFFAHQRTLSFPGGERGFDRAEFANGTGCVSINLTVLLTVSATIEARTQAQRFATIRSLGRQRGGR
jgi:hypothetical protein